MSDVVIIGGGPAGLTLGCYLADAGSPCVVIERANHPRPHVGESLMPATVRIFREIGFLPVMEAADFPRSGGIVYHDRGRRGIQLAYSEFPQQGVEQGYTYHVDRAKFDLLLMKHAESKGCRVVQGVTVKEVTFDSSGRATGVEASIADQDVFFPARVVVDAGGRATRLGRQLGLRHDHPVLDQFALHAWFYDVDRGKRATELYTHVFFLPELRGWAWQAPIDDEITSIGLVADKRAYQDSGEDVESFFMDGLAKNEALAEATRDAVRINELRGEANCSYRLDHVCGNGWLAIGDAARFIDPIFSSGVSVAMHTARFASERIRAALESGDLSRATFVPYEDHLLAGAAIWDDFIHLFYRLLPSFLHVVEAPEHRESVLRLLQGDVYAEAEAGALAAMRELVRTVEEADEHPLASELMEFPVE